MINIYKRADGKWAWQLVAGNGEIVATDGGQGFERRIDCTDSARRVVTGFYATGGPEFTLYPHGLPEGGRSDD